MAERSAREIQRAWQLNNPDKVKAQRARAYAKFKERYKTDMAFRDRIRANNLRWEKTHPAKANASHQRIRNLRRAWVDAEKAKMSCIRCGESDVACLDFHHRDPKQKLFSLAAVGTHGWSIAKLEAEIKKCDVICANCHRKEHRKILRAPKAVREQFYGR